MPVVLTLVLLVFWMAMAYRAFERGDVLLTSVFVLVGIALTVFRLRGASRSGESSSATKP